MNDIFIGGEYFYSPSRIFKKKEFDLNSYLIKNFKEKYFTLTGGGFYSIIRILQQMHLNSNVVILLPSYLCPTMLIPFKRLNVKYRFFKINDKLEIDTNDLLNKITNKVKGLFFINYFGFRPDQKVISVIKELKEQGIIIIEDIVQSFFSNIELIGNYAFNSFRKFLPVDGSIIISDTLLNSPNNKSYNTYFIYKLLGQLLRFIRYKFDYETTDYYLKLFENAEKVYYKQNHNRFNTYNKFILSKFDIDSLCKNRRRNFSFFLENLKSISFYKNLDQDIVPFGFPIIINSRDEIRKKLIKKNIFCPIHWILPNEINKNEFKDSWYLSEHLLTVPINENSGVAKYEYFKKVWEDIK